MSTAHHRRKDPEKVRKTLLVAARQMASDKGLAALSLQAVAATAGVTKGALFHHFTNKQALVDAVFADLLESLDRDIDARIAADGQAHGCFTRAYADVVCRLGADEPADPHAALWVSAISDPKLRERWADWMTQRLDRHRRTDDAPPLAIVRHAADGVWLADLAGIDIPDRAALRDRLIAATHPTPTTEPKAP
ncbi:TetR/AcrR family transcriptional regulator [Stappia taiwanensis]|uniref:TetR/AcrR family transcriptional regulator n=1 Tax=Stappia taiwanensis TaxID=992267 RepID=A0A838XV98_9HYPH|nr:TetR/AcrR family transcriptional regulator [Stappia taiwanensis]MBA4612951.1 TetR/AcrR family transcriptional regulator [Stappia taiwanensis]GGF06559.1 TetR family transcriptional regulator [Stappia taiwanensis]